MTSRRAAGRRVAPQEGFEPPTAGAGSVAIGKLMIWALAAGGEPGLQQTLDILRREIITTMASVGASTLADLTPDLLLPSFAPPAAPWPVEPMDLMTS